MGKAAKKPAEKTAKNPAKKKSGKAHRVAARKWAAEASAADREIAQIPPVADPERRAAASDSLQVFCETYFGAAFSLAWSNDHLRVIEKIEIAAKAGGLFGEAMPRGNGKTTLMLVACLWAVVCGHRRFVCLVGASADKAGELLGTIKTWLETNELLRADFPEVIEPIRALERMTNRARGQTFRGQWSEAGGTVVTEGDLPRPTRIEWAADKVVLPTIAGSAASGAIISSTGMKGGDIRGQQHALPNGEIIRPDLAVLDDPQTRESANSPAQCQQREAILSGDILGMAGPGKKIAAVCCCTVIRPGDMADRILNRDKHPLWQGERTKLIYALPTDQKLWATYRQLREDSYRADRHGEEATEFYRQHKAEMDAGALPAWPERFNEDELSAVQHAMNLLFRDEASFWAEYQNEPLREDRGNGQDLTADQVAEKAAAVDVLKRGVAPAESQHVTAFVDVQQRLLFWVVVAWRGDFTGHVLDYGCWPRQKRAYFTYREVRDTLATRHPGMGLEASILAGLESLADELLGVEWLTETGVPLRVERCLVDANWSESTEVVYRFCRQSKYAAALLPSHGKGIGASGLPMSAWSRQPGDKLGLNWRIPATAGKQVKRHVVYETNFWKSFVHQRLAVARGDRGALTLFGKPTDHRLFADHITAEYRVRTEGRGRTVDEWKLRPEKPDNHWLDGLSGCAVAASMLGCELLGAVGPEKSARKRVSWAESRAQQRS